jgi:mRNA interferase MazF
MIVEVDLDPVVGHEQGRSRPCVVVQNNAGNRFSSMTIVVPLTDATHIRKPSAIYVLAKKGDGGLRKDSVLLSDLSPETMTAVDRALQISLGLARGGKA